MMKSLFLVLAIFLISCGASIPSYHVLEGSFTDEGALSPTKEGDLLVHFKDRLSSVNSSYSFTLQAEFEDGAEMTIYLFSKVQDRSFEDGLEVSFERSGDDLSVSLPGSLFDDELSGVFSSTQSRVSLVFDVHNFNDTGKVCAGDQLDSESFSYLWHKDPYSFDNKKGSTSSISQGEGVEWGVLLEKGVKLLKLEKAPPKLNRCSKP